MQPTTFFPKLDFINPKVADFIAESCCSSYGISFLQNENGVCEIASFRMKIDVASIKIRVYTTVLFSYCKMPSYETFSCKILMSLESKNWATFSPEWPVRYARQSRCKTKDWKKEENFPQKCAAISQSLESSEIRPRKQKKSTDKFKFWFPTKKKKSCRYMWTLSCAYPRYFEITFAHR